MPEKRRRETGIKETCGGTKIKTCALSKRRLIGVLYCLTLCANSGETGGRASGRSIRNQSSLMGEQGGGWSGI